MRVDLHMHSTASDGTSPPAALAEECRAAGLTHAILTDHDTAAGVAAFCAACATAGVRAISGVEFNCVYDGELHILGYGFDPAHPALARCLAEMAEERARRTGRMVANLNAAGIGVSLERVAEIAGSGVMGRPHIAQALIELHLAADIPEAFAKYLNRGCVGYSHREKLPSREAISLTRAAGGRCVLAHPLLTHDADLPGLIRRLAKEGIEGIEAYYPLHSDADAAFFLKQARELGLFVTAGSDYHGAGRHGTYLGKEARMSLELEAGVRLLFGEEGAV